MGAPRNVSTGPGAWTVECAGAERTREVGARLGRLLRSPPAGGFVVALHGELGAGKTVFVQGLARGLGVREPIVSPTFTVARDYRAAGPPAVALHHVDAYRLRGDPDLEAAGFEEMWGEGRITCVEWAERVEGSLPVERIDVSLEATGATAEGDAPRRLTLRAGGAKAESLLRRLREEPA